VAEQTFMSRRRLGYTNIQLIDVNQATIPVNINSTISIQGQRYVKRFVPIFGGNVVDIGLEVRDVGSTMFTQTYSITALGALARLPKALTNGVLSRILTVIRFTRYFQIYCFKLGLKYQGH
jgi:hypothetical protein